MTHVEEYPGWMTRAGARVTWKVFDEADHFLLFSHREQLLPVLEEWFRRER